MKLFIGLAAFLIAATAGAIDPAALQKVYMDAAVVDRIAEISNRDLPADVLKKIVEEDIDLLRGKRNDGSYEYATYERLEASRTSTSASVQPRKNNDLEKIDVRGAWAYRLIISSPSRRLVMTKNRKIYIDRVELDFIPEGSTTARQHSIPVEEWLEPGQVRPIDFPDVAKQLTARVFARADEKDGYGNMVLTVVQARVVDNADSPYADSVASAKAMLRALETREIKSLRAMAGRIRSNLAPARTGEPAARSIEVVAPSGDPELAAELQAIEDLLTGSEAERREGLDRLRQLVRKTRAR